MCKKCRKENPDCPFCDIGSRAQQAYFDKEGEALSPYQTWIDVEEKNGEIQWYAVLNGSQFTPGHTMVILGCHMDKPTEIIDDSDIQRQEKLQSMMLGINRVANRLKEKLGAETVHVLGLCEGMSHLHFHLIPRYSYTSDEVKFFRDNYRERYSKINQMREFNKVINEKKIHGMWYDAHKEMNYVFTEFNKKSKKQRAIELVTLAKDLRIDQNGKKQEIINRLIKMSSS